MEFTRKTHRLDSNEYSGQRWSFVTMCCENRYPAFSDAGRANWMIECLRTESLLQGFLVDAYCVMPDHLHFLTFGKNSSSKLLVFAKSLKQKTGFSFQKETGSRLWQKNYYDHVLRANEEANRVAGYIWMNPVRKGLCKSFEDYLFSGSFTRPWKDLPQGEGWTPPWKEGRMSA